ncbi:chalcone isomerase family protein [Aquimarina sp. AU474]|uniref:chalcone isomerase family protein n=1 Tax=Aquimarina sp. AU474 TaxID=2108529 RepID=UPI000D686A17|nr:chalcone isomerase family protein [Aquimarina sp. AU474]
MKKVIYYVIIFTTTFSFSQTKVGSVHFNDVDTFDGSELMLNGAGQREKMYAMGLYLDFEVDGVDDGVRVAEKDDNMAITIKVTSSFAGPELKNIIRNGMERATDGNSYLLENQIRDFLSLLPKKINKFDIFKIVHTKGGNISVFKNRELLGTINSPEFKKALFKIWLGENPVDLELKENLLASYEPNPVLGKWKTYDKKTGVAINIVQMYMLKDKLFGSIVEMLRHSEKDDVCYDCQGDDKNQKVEGLVIIKNLKLKGDNRYAGGKFTNIRSGEISDCQMWIEEDSKDVLFVKYKGSKGTHEWKRVKE